MCTVPTCTPDSRKVTFSGRRGLRGDRPRSTERDARPVEEDVAQRGEALRRQVAAVVGPVAVGPLVVAGGVDERLLEGVEGRADLCEVRVGALLAARLDVADVDDGVRVRGVVDGRDVGREGGELRCAVGGVADHGQRRLDRERADVGVVGEEAVHALVEELADLRLEVADAGGIGRRAQLGGQERVLAPERVRVHQQARGVRVGDERVGAAELPSGSRGTT